MSCAPDVCVGGICLLSRCLVRKFASGQELAHFGTATHLVNECGVEPWLIDAKSRIHHEAIAIEALNVVALVGAAVTPNVNAIFLHGANKQRASNCAAKWCCIEVGLACCGDVEGAALKSDQSFVDKFFATINQSRNFCAVFLGLAWNA